MTKEVMQGHSGKNVGQEDQQVMSRDIAENGQDQKQDGNRELGVAMLDMGSANIEFIGIGE